MASWQHGASSVMQACEVETNVLIEVCDEFQAKDAPEDCEAEETGLREAKSCSGRLIQFFSAFP
jgi:hypothetical protein